MSRNIIDDIDALIDEQLDGGEDGQHARTDRCPHCGRNWHGLAITARMEQMRDEYREVSSQAYADGNQPEYAESGILGDYRYDQDDSEILCPGSRFIGSMPAKRPRGGRWGLGR